MRRSIVLLILVLLIFVLLPGPSLVAQPLRQMDAVRADAAAAADREPEILAPPTGAEVLQLDNGLAVLLLPNPSQPMVGVYTQVKVGSAWESFATSGMSHMLEHLLFNGTDEYSQEELYAEADRVGAYNNAHTTDFYTDFMMVLPDEHLETGMKLQSQMLFHSRIPEDKFAKEQGIVLGELAMSRDRGDPFFATTLRDVMYHDSALTLPTLGTTATIAALERDAVHDFYKAWYVPNNMIVTVAGGFARDQAVSWLEQYYGAVPPATLPRVEFPPAESIDRTESISRRGGTRRMAALVFEAPAYGDPDRIAFDLATALLTAEGSGILPLALQDLPEEDRPSLASWWQAAPGHARYVLQFSLTPSTDPSQLYRLVQTAVTASLESGLQEEDLAAVVARERTSALKQREQLRMTGIYLAEPLVLGGPDAVLGRLDRLAATTTEDVAAVLRTWLVDEPCLALLVEPAAADEAAAAQARPTVARSELSGGAVLATETDPHGELLAVHLTVRGRARLDQRYGQAGTLNLVHRLLTSGVAGCDEACLARRLGAIGAEIKLVDDPRFPMDDYYTNGRFSFIRLECPAEHAEEALDLLSDLVQFSSFTEDDLARERRAQLAILTRHERSASARSRQLLREGLYGDHPLVLPPEGTTASVKAITYDDVRSLYRQAFRPENLIVSVVSPLPHAEVAGLLEALPDGGGDRPVRTPVPLTTAPARLTETMGGPLGVVRVGSVRAIDPQDATALELLVGILSDRLQMDLRETRGLGYSVGANIADVGDGRAVFTAWVNPPTARVAEGEQALAEALRTFDAASISDDEFTEVRNARQGRLLMRRLDSISRAYYLAMSELETGGTTAYETQIAAHDDVTLADLQRVASFFSELPLVTVVVD